MRDPGRRGFSIIEGMVAMAVMLIGVAGLIGLQTMGVRMNGDARRMTRATAIAQDLLNQIELWPYTDVRLSNANTANDADLGDSAFAFEGTGTPPADHAEGDLTLGGTQWLGIQTLPPGYQRYWNVSNKDPASAAALLDANGNGVEDALRVAVVVRWQHQGGWRRVVLTGLKRNPSEVQ